MSDTSYIDRMEVEYKELHAKFEGLKAYLANKSKNNATYKLNEPVPEPVNVHESYDGLETNLLHDQFYAMEGYLRSLGGRIQLAKAREGLL